MWVDMRSRADRPASILVSSQRRPLVYAGLGVATLLLVYLAAMRNPAVRGWDERVRQAPFVRLPGILDVGEAFLSAVNITTVAAMALLLLVAALIGGRHRGPLLAATLAFTGANLTAQALKTILGSVDPLAGETLRGDAGAFPSGHVTVATSLVVALVFVVPLAFRIAIAVVGSSFVACVGVTVLANGWHYPTDVLGAIALSLVWSAIASLALRAEPAQRRHKRLRAALPVTLLVVGVWAYGIVRSENLSRDVTVAAALVVLAAASATAAGYRLAAAGIGRDICAPPDDQVDRRQSDPQGMTKQRAALGLMRWGGGIALVIVALALLTVTVGGWDQQSTAVRLAGDPADSLWHGSRGTATHGSALRQIDFPNDPGLPGTGLPNQDGGKALGGFDAIDYQGYDQGANQRITWVRDPLGSGQVVARFTVKDGDVATHWGGTRSEIYTLTRDHVAGKEAWFTWSWLLADGKRGAYFKRPRTRGLGFQLWNDGPPPVSIDFAGGHQSLVLRQQREVSGAGAEWIPIGGYHRGVRQYFLLHVKFADDATGSVRLWHTAGRPPTARDRAVVSRSGILTHHADKPGGPKLGLYLPDGLDDTANFPWTYYIYGYRRASTKALALAKWQSVGAPRSGSPD